MQYTWTIYTWTSSHKLQEKAILVTRGLTFPTRTTVPRIATYLPANDNSLRFPTFIWSTVGKWFDSKYHHLTTTLHLTLKMTTAQVVETSVTNNSLSKDYPHPDNHAKQIKKSPVLCSIDWHFGQEFTGYSSLLLAGTHEILHTFFPNILAKQKIKARICLYQNSWPWGSSEVWLDQSLSLCETQQ